MLMMMFFHFPPASPASPAPPPPRARYIIYVFEYGTFSFVGLCEIMYIFPLFNSSILGHRESLELTRGKDRKAKKRESAI